MLTSRILDYMRLRRYRWWAMTLTVAALLMTQLPLVDDFGFEFAVGAALVCAYAAGCLSALHFVNRKRLISSPGGPFPEYWSTLSAHLALLLPLFIIMTIKSVLAGLCNYTEGLAFFALIPGVTVLFATAIGALCGLMATRPRRACLLFIGYTILTFALGIYRLLTEPPVFAYHPIIGYFPGPIYDEVVRITPTLLIARGYVLLQTIAVVAGLTLCVDPAGWRIDPRRLLRRWSWPAEAGYGAARFILLLALAGLALMWVYRAPLGMEIDRTYIRETLGGYRRTPHFDIYYDINAETARRIDLIALDHEYQYDRLSRYLKVTPTRRIRSYIYATPDQKKRLMGARYTSVERPGDDEMHLNDEPFPHPVMRHELAHVLSSSFGNRLYGGSYKMGFHEGLAVAADWDEDRLTPHQWSRAMRQLGLAPALDGILGTVGFWMESPSRSYTLCGSFVRFLIDRYGMDTFKRAFPDGDVQTAYHRPISDLIGEWATFIDGITLSEREVRIARQRFLSPSIFERRCAHEVAALMDFAWDQYGMRRYMAAIETFNRIRALEPNNPSALRGLLYAHYRLGNHERAGDMAAVILSREDRVVGLRTDAHMIQGDMAWKRGDAGAARIRYIQALEMHASDSADREAQIKLAALDHPDIADRVLSYLLADQGQDSQVALVMEAVSMDPAFAPGYYLIGRRLFNAEAYESALPYFIRADTLSLPDDLLETENKRLMGLCFFYTGAYESAAATFRQMVESDSTSEAMKNTAEEWMARCAWFRNQRTAGENP